MTGTCGSQIYKKIKRAAASIRSSADYSESANIVWEVAKSLGWTRPDGTIHPTMDNGKRSIFSAEKYKYLLTAPFEISPKCCHITKKAPMHEYQKRTGRHPIIGMLAEESFLRRQRWLATGCNTFDGRHAASNPMSFWREQDVLRYIKEKGLPIASPYGEIVPDYAKMGLVDGQCSMFADAGDVPLKCSGAQRTGCMACGFGAHIKGDDRFVRLKQTHPKMYDWIMRPQSEGGLGYKAVIDWLNEYGDVHIRY